MLIKDYTVKITTHKGQIISPPIEEVVKVEYPETLDDIYIIIERDGIKAVCKALYDDAKLSASSLLRRQKFGGEKQKIENVRKGTRAWIVATQVGKPIFLAWCEEVAYGDDTAFIDRTTAKLNGEIVKWHTDNAANGTKGDREEELDLDAE